MCIRDRGYDDDYNDDDDDNVTDSDDEYYSDNHDDINDNDDDDDSDDDSGDDSDNNYDDVDGVTMTITTTLMMTMTLTVTMTMTMSTWVTMTITTTMTMMMEILLRHTVWNYTDRRAETPTLCTFYNSDFLIYSSMGSFYIPCVIMICLYSRIFFAIRAHARKATAAAAARKRAITSTTAAKNVDANDKTTAAPPPTVVHNKPETVNQQKDGNTVVAVDMVGAASSMPGNDIAAGPTAAAEDAVRIEGQADEAGSSRQSAGAVEPVIWTKRDGLLSPPEIVVEREHPSPEPAANPRGSDVSIRPVSSPGKSLVNRLKLPGRRRCSSDKRSAEKAASRRERKATKTLAIVLGL